MQTGAQDLSRCSCTQDVSHHMPLIGVGWVSGSCVQCDLPMQSVEFSAGPRGPLLPGSGNAPMQCPSQVSLNQGPSQVHGVDPRLLGGLSPGLGTMTMHNQMQIPLNPGPVKARARCSRVLVWDQV